MAKFLRQRQFYALDMDHWRMTMKRRCLFTLCLGLLLFRPGGAAELAVLTEANWDKLAPLGKEVDCILGDYALKSDRLWAVVAQPAPWRNANMTVKQVGGAVIDLTLTDQP